MSRRPPDAIVRPGHGALLHNDRGSGLGSDSIQLLIVALTQRLPTNAPAPVLRRVAPQHPGQRLEAVHGATAAVPVATPVKPGLDPHHVAVLDRGRAQEGEARQPGVLDVPRREEDHGAAPEDYVQPAVARDHGARPEEVALLDLDPRRQDHGADGHGRAAHEVDEGVDKERRVVT